LKPGVDTLSVVVKFTGVEADAVAARPSVTSTAIRRGMHLFIVFAPFDRAELSDARCARALTRG
jgi:hypothetical protein